MLDIIDLVNTSCQTISVELLKTYLGQITGK